MGSYNDLQSLPNIGPTIADRLQEAGIHSAQELRSAGAEDAFLRLRVYDPGACLHELLALEGAIEGVKKAMLPEEKKEELRLFFKKL